MVQAQLVAELVELPFKVTPDAWQGVVVLALAVATGNRLEGEIVTFLAIISSPLLPPLLFAEFTIV